MKTSNLPKKGNHTARAIDGDFGENANGNEYVLVRFEIVEGENSGTRVSDRFYLTERSADRTIEGLRYCGCAFPGEDITNLQGIDRNLVRLVIEHEAGNNGKTHYRIRWINSLGRSVPKEEAMTGARKENFRQRMRGHVLKSGQGQGGGSGQYPEPPPLGDSDIPF